MGYLHRNRLIKANGQTNPIYLFIAHRSGKCSIADWLHDEITAKMRTLWNVYNMVSKLTPNNSVVLVLRYPVFWDHVATFATFEMYQWTVM